MIGGCSVGSGIPHEMFNYKERNYGKERLLEFDETFFGYSR